MKPIIKWAGGKTRQVAMIREAFGGPCRGVYYEPFAGSAAVFLHRRASGQVRRAVLADANDKLVAMLRAVRDDVEGVLDALGTLPESDWRERYGEVRDAFNQGPTEGAMHAARFVWLNRACFNGLYRENRHGAFNVPVGAYDRLYLPDPDHVRAVSELLQSAEIVAADFRDVMAAATARDQVYCDPPYVPRTRTASFTAYCRHRFGLEEQRALAQCALDAAARGARVVLSNHDLPIVREELYPTCSGFHHVHHLEVARAISQKGSTRGPVPEMIAAIGPRTVAA